MYNRFACKLLKPEAIDKFVKKGISKLELRTALPSSFNLYRLVSQLNALQVCMGGNYLMFMK